MNPRFIKLISYTIIITSIASFIANHKTSDQSSAQRNVISPTPFIATAVTIVSSPTPMPISNEDLQKTVENALEGANSTYAVAIYNFKTGENYYRLEHKEFEAASLYKLWIMATAYQQIQNGQLNEDEIMSRDIQYLNHKFDIDPELAELTVGTITLSVKDALEQMITISHNYAALLLSEKITLPAVADFLKANNFQESKLGEPPVTTAYDISLFLEKLYRGELANEEYTREMLGLLKRQTLNNKLPKYLPVNVAVAHKTGEIYSFTHDAGIVFSDKGDYVIAIMADSTIPAAAEDRIADISKAVYDYFNNK
jgi:beta-lactamase class A